VCALDHLSICSLLPLLSLLAPYLDCSWNGAVVIDVGMMLTDTGNGYGIRIPGQGIERDCEASGEVPRMGICAGDNHAVDINSIRRAVHDNDLSTADRRSHGGTRTARRA